jgi:hypothetical protein
LTIQKKAVTSGTLEKAFRVRAMDGRFWGVAIVRGRDLAAAQARRRP